ncbi:MAG: Nramp family divalent metal transporter [Mariniblastus sp.]|nr:Nramp family divalent metal transporter [Mariniblastus sp.]
MEENRKLRGIGPAIFVTAAFIGPGTVMTASRAGAEFGYGLLWAVLFSVMAAIILQEMAARLGIVTGGGLAEAIHSTIRPPAVRWLFLALVLCGILIGNAAYQTGNLLGAAAGLEILYPANPSDGEILAGLGTAKLGAVLIAVASLIVIWIGRFRFLQICLVVLVSIMGLLFLLAAIALGPNLAEMAYGLIPAAPTPRTGEEASGMGNLWLVIGLIGTTVVPYNLFLHASSAAVRWPDRDHPSQGVRQSLWDTLISVSIGGLITASLLVSAAIAFADGGQLTNIRDIATQLRPLLGNWAEFAFAIGILAAGLSSSITAPIAAGFATAGCFGHRATLSSPSLKWVATLVVLVGLVCALQFGRSPAEAIILAQVANGLLLPLIAVFLLIMVNQTRLMKQMANGWVANVLGFSIVLLTAFLALRQLLLVWEKIQGWWFVS